MIEYLPVAVHLRTKNATRCQHHVLGRSEIDVVVEKLARRRERTYHSKHHLAVFYDEFAENDVARLVVRLRSFVDRRVSIDEHGRAVAQRKVAREHVAVAHFPRRRRSDAEPRVDGRVATRPDRDLRPAVVSSAACLVDEVIVGFDSNGVGSVRLLGVERYVTLAIGCWERKQIFSIVYRATASACCLTLNKGKQRQDEGKQEKS